MPTWINMFTLCLNLYLAIRQMLCLSASHPTALMLLYSFMSRLVARMSRKLIPPLAFETVFLQIYNGVFMNNTLGLVIFLLLVYIRDLSWNVSAEVLVVLIVCVLMGLFTSLITKFPLWTGIIACLLYPISIGFLYLLTEVLGWSWDGFRAS